MLLSFGKYLQEVKTKLTVSTDWGTFSRTSEHPYSYVVLVHGAPDERGNEYGVWGWASSLPLARNRAKEAKKFLDKPDGFKEVRIYDMQGNHVE